MIEEVLFISMQNINLNIIVFACQTKKAIIITANLHNLFLFEPSQYILFMSSQNNGFRTCIQKYLFVIFWNFSLQLETFLVFLVSYWSELSRITHIKNVDVLCIISSATYDSIKFSRFKSVCYDLTYII
jgi:hypothetical protein